MPACKGTEHNCPKSNNTTLIECNNLVTTSEKISWDGLDTATAPSEQIITSKPHLNCRKVTIFLFKQQLMKG